MSASVVAFPTKKPMGKITAIASGKGGVGKTFLAVSIARALAERGDRVLLGVQPDLHLGHVMNGEATLAEAVCRIAGGAANPGGFDLLPGANGIAALADLGTRDVQRIAAGIQALSFSYDRIIIDLAAGIGHGVLKLAAEADEVLVVALDEPSSLTDGYAFVKLLRARQPKARIGVVANRVKNKHEALRVHTSFARACNTWLGFEPGKAGHVHEDSLVKSAMRAQSLLSKHAPQAKALGDIEAVVSSIRNGAAFDTRVAMTANG
jgi:flagellar biosynthesis protein FlhG